MCRQTYKMKHLKMKFEALFIPFLIIITCTISYSKATFVKQAANSTFPCRPGQLCSKATSQNVKNMGSTGTCASDSDCNKHADEVYQCVGSECVCQGVYVYAWEVGDYVCVTPKYYIGDSCAYDAQCNFYWYDRECDSGECEEYWYWVAWKKWVCAIGCLLAVAALAGGVGFCIYRYKQKKAMENRLRMQPQELVIIP